MEAKPGFISFVLQIVLLVVLLGLVNMVFNLSGAAFVLELIILLVLIAAGVVTVVGLNNNLEWVGKFTAGLLAIIFLDMLFIFSISGKTPEFFGLMIAATVAGFFITLFGIKKPKPEKEGKKTQRVKTSYKPGKYVASKMGKTFHSPKCEWAKRIQKKNRVWFASDKEAKKAKYKAHRDCV